MSDQIKFERMLRLIVLLSNNNYYSISNIADKLNISERTIYRYIDTFRNTGFVVDKNSKGYFKIDKNESNFKEIHNLLHFSEEESFILLKAIHAIDDNNFLKQSLASKLYSLYDSDRVIDTIVKKEKAETVGNLTKAIQDNKQVKVIDYKSANSNSVSTRVLEPYEFTTNFISVWCFDTDDKQNKLFKTSRMSKVIVLNNYEYQHLHKKGFIDCFRISSDKKINIKLQLNLRARNLLTEEYPLAEKFIKEINKNTFVFESYVCNFDGVGRFVLGLLNDIVVIAPTQFKSFLNKKVINKSF